MSNYHIPVLKSQSIDFLIKDRSGIYIDATFGGGGYTKEILSRLNSRGNLYAFDVDLDAKKESEKITNNNFYFINDNFSNIKENLEKLNIKHVDGIVADLGVSSYQIDTPNRGFSYRFESELDMRMNSLQKKSAYEVINKYKKEKLISIFNEYGELSNSKKIARVILEHRTIQPIKNTKKFLEILRPLVPSKKLNKTLSKIFQSIRIEVNDEIDNLKKLLLLSKDVLKTQSRLVILSYHSLEDRLVKRFLNTGNFKNIYNRDNFGNILRPFNPVTKKAIKASQEEIEFNNRCRSVRLRVGEKI